MRCPDFEECCEPEACPSERSSNRQRLVGSRISPTVVFHGNEAHIPDRSKCIAAAMPSRRNPVESAGRQGLARLPVFSHREGPAGETAPGTICMPRQVSAFGREMVKTACFCSWAKERRPPMSLSSLYERARLRCRSASSKGRMSFSGSLMRFWMGIR